MFNNVLLLGFPAWGEILIAVLIELIFGKAVFFNPVKWISRAVWKIDDKIRLSLGQSAVNRDNAYAIGACALLALAFVAVVSGITLLIRT
ncbi:MAG: hypothetical protein ACOYIR_01160, partial [Christensenellales bacterium]